MTTDTTARNSSVFSEGPARGPAERDVTVEAFSLHPDPVTLRDRVEAGLAAAKAWIVPPNVLVSPPEAFAELVAYATRGTWTASAGGLRRLGSLWLVAVALPVIFCLRMAEWVIQRPSRAVLFAVVWQLVIRSDAGPWLSDLIRWFWSALGWIFLS